MTKRYDEYKDSGIEWLGEIPSHWNAIRLKDKISISSGKTAIKEDNGYLLYGANGVIGKTKDFNIDRKKIIIGRVGSCGAINVAKAKSFISDNALIVDEKTVNFSYLHYLLINKNLGNIASKVAMPLITAGKILEEISPFSGDKIEQKAISTYLDNKTSKIDSAVAELTKQKDLLIELKKSTIHQAVTKGFDSTVEMKDSGVELIGEVPEHWGLSKIKTVSKIEKGKKVDSLDYEEYGYKKLLSMAYLRGKEEAEFVPYDKVKFAKEGECLILWDGANAGEIIKAKEGVLSSTVALFKMRRNINNNYFYYLLTVNEDSFRKLYTGMGIPHVSGDVLKNTQIFLPKRKEQDEISTFLDKKIGQIDQSIDIIDNQITKMKEYKKTLINDVVTGKRKVI